MKKYLVILAAASIALSLPGCSRAQSSTAAPSTGASQQAGAVQQVEAARQAEVRAVVPEFRLTAPQLERIVAGLPADIQSTIMARPAEFLRLTARVLDEPADYFALVDKSHALAADYVPPELVRLRDYGLSISNADLLLRKSIMPEVTKMSRAAKADGVVLLFSSTYRSYATQRWVYDREVADYGKAVADRESAHPGESQHQLGTAIDFGSITDAFAKTEAAHWLEAHAWEYGFSLSYPQEYEWLTGYRYEVWHYRYITPPGVLMQREFFDNVQQYLLVFLHDHRAELAAARLSPAG